jgi:7-cyano-7-deazaguanine synthase in queuosine biosynthesis
MAKIFVPWSGGLDSTRLLALLSNQGHQVTCGHIEIINNVEKNKREEEARSKIIKSGYLSKYNISYDGCIYKADLSLKNKALGLIQVPVWIAGLVNHVCDRFDKVALGYVMNDDAISFLDDIKRIYNAYNGVMQPGEKLPKLIFPLIKSHKRILWRDLDDDVKHLVSWCENTRGDEDDCGSCVPCSKMKHLGLAGNRFYKEDVPVLEEKEVVDKAPPVRHR